LAAEVEAEAAAEVIEPAMRMMTTGVTKTRKRRRTTRRRRTRTTRRRATRGATRRWWSSAVVALDCTQRVSISGNLARR
jgi:hypothetical protein